MMNCQQVSSSNLAFVCYDGAAVMDIGFHNGGTYRYWNVPTSVYAGLMSAASKGSYFAAYIKGRYRYAKVG